MGWVQLYVRAPVGNGYNTPVAMQRVDEHLTGVLSACFKAPEGVPIPEPDGTFEIRVYVAQQVGLVKLLLTSHYGLVIEKEVLND